MRRATVRTGAGALRGREAEAGLLAALAPLVEAAAREQRVLSGLCELGTRQAWLKGDHLPGSARLRHSLRRTLGLGTPREREFANLLWLRGRLFRAPRPLAAASLSRAGWLGYHVLALEPLGAHRTLAEALPGAPPEQRGAWLDELARECARMHALHFVHRDLYLRNVLVAPDRSSGDRRELVFIDAWRSGAPLPRRGADYDLACLLLEGAELMSGTEQRCFLAQYFEQRARQGSPADVRGLLSAAAERRAVLVERALRQPHRQRQPGAPGRAWDWRDVSP